jgi:serine/threonine-protein kinase
LLQWAGSGYGEFFFAREPTLATNDNFPNDKETRFIGTSSVELNPTVTQVQGPASPSRRCEELCRRYDAVLLKKRHSWTSHLRLIKKIGFGGQGIVYLTERRGSDGFTLTVALKVFSPERYSTPAHYDSDMSRMGRVAAKVAQIQHENLLVVENFLDRDRIRMMVMEWVEGFDLRRLLAPELFSVMERRFEANRLKSINEVLITPGPQQSRFLPGAAVAIVRDCLEALAAMHRQNIVHGDVKPGNIMLKRSGHAKIIDIGSAFDLEDPPKKQTCTPAYAALEVLEGKENTPRSDLASLGYVLLELLAGKSVFTGVEDFNGLILAKRTLKDRLAEIMPEEVACNDLLMSFLGGLIAPDPADRFPDAESANLVDVGAAAFHRQLIKNDLSTEYENDIRIWIDELLELEAVEPRLLWLE